jgi:hypothetical protein
MIAFEEELPWLTGTYRRSSLAVAAPSERLCSKVFASWIGLSGFGFQLIVDGCKSFVYKRDRFAPGLKGFRGVARIEAPRVRLFRGVSAFGFFKPLLKVSKPLFEIFFAHASTQYM